MKTIAENIAEIRALHTKWTLLGLDKSSSHADRLMAGMQFNERAADEILALCDSHEALEKALAATESDYMAVRRSLLAERDRLKEALAGLMPFVLEGYFPDCATPEFKSAVEAAKKLTHENQDSK